MLSNGHTKSRANRVTLRKIAQTLSRRNISVTTKYISSQENSTEDFLSRFPEKQGPGGYKSQKNTGVPGSSRSGRHRLRKATRSRNEEIRYLQKSTVVT